MLRLQSMGAVIGVVFSTSLFILVGYGSQAVAHDRAQKQNSVCPGFVILPNGHAVWSQEETAAGQSSSHRHGKGHGDHTVSEPGQMAMQTKQSHQQMQGHDHQAHQGDESGERSDLMGYQHGSAIMPKENMLCVPVGSQTDTAWMTVSSSDALSVMVESIQGPLAHNSRTNEGLRLTILKRDSSEAMNASQVRVFVRMPHHDHRMPGGHGMANDPDVSGIEAQLDKTGRYTLPTLDFSMAGAWLVEVQVTNGAKMHKAYFAAQVGEE